MATRKKIPDVMGELLAGVADKPVNQHTSIPVNQEIEGKAKVTYYLSQQTVDSLEEVKLRLRRLAPKEKRQISSSAIVNAALQIVFAELETEGPKSQLASMLVNQ